MRRATAILETSLYVADLDRSRSFYQRVFGFEQFVDDGRMCALGVPGSQVLLLFQHGSTNLPAPVPGGIIPPHHGAGDRHLASALRWASFKLGGPSSPARHPGGEPDQMGVRRHQPYFRDPDGHSLEVATRGLSPNHCMTAPRLAGLTAAELLLLLALAAALFPWIMPSEDRAARDVAALSIFVGSYPRLRSARRRGSDRPGRRGPGRRLPDGRLWRRAAPGCLQGSGHGHDHPAARDDDHCRQSAHLRFPRVGERLGRPGTCTIRCCGSQPSCWVRRVLRLPGE